MFVIYTILHSWTSISLQCVRHRNYITLQRICLPIRSDHTYSLPFYHLMQVHIFIDVFSLTTNPQRQSACRFHRYGILLKRYTREGPSNTLGDLRMDEFAV